MWNKKTYEDQKKKAEEYALKKKQRQELYAIRHQYDKERKTLTTCKKLTIFALADCVVIQIFSMFAMIYLQDISAIYSLIAIVGSILCEVFSLVSYNHKSTKENTEGGITYQDMMNKFEIEHGGDVIVGSRKEG